MVKYAFKTDDIKGTSNLLSGGGGDTIKGGVENE